MSYRIVHIYSNGEEKYITFHPVEHKQWRSKKVEDARIWRTAEDAHKFIQEKYEFPIKYRLEEVK